MLFSLVSYFSINDTYFCLQQQSNSFPDIKVASGQSVESPVSSRTSSPDSQRRAASRTNSMTSSISVNSTATTQMNFLQKQMQQQQVQVSLEFNKILCPNSQYNLHT